jgi:hypothetical protein
MSFAGKNLQILLFIACVDKPVIVVDTPAESLSVFERLRFSNTLQKPIPLNVVYQLIDPLKGLSIFGLPFKVLFKGVGSKDKIIHFPWLPTVPWLR